MPRQWQFPALADGFAPTSQTSNAQVSGWESIAPDIVKRRTVDAGHDNLPLRALPQPIFHDTSFTCLYVDAGPRSRPVFPGHSDLPYNQPPAATAANPLGWEGVSPWRSPKVPTQFGTIEFTLFQPPAATAQNPLGWEGVSPWRMPKSPTQFGTTEFTLFQPPAATAQNPLGWEATGPWRSPKTPTQFGTVEYALNQPPAATGANPLGWEATGPWKATKIPTQFGTVEYTLFKPTAATAGNPLGWEGIVPPAILRRVTPGPDLVAMPLDQPAPPPTLLPIAWPVYIDRQPKRPTDAGGYAETLRALPQPPAPGAGFEAISPWLGKRGTVQFGWVDWALNQPPASTATNPLGWEAVSPWQAARVMARPGLVEYLPFQVMATPAGWEAYAPTTATRKGSPGIATDAPVAPASVAVTVGWSAAFTDRTIRRQLDVGGYVETLRSLPQPVAPGTGFEAVAPWWMPKVPTQFEPVVHTLFVATIVPPIHRTIALQGMATTTFYLSGMASTTIAIAGSATTEIDIEGE